MSIIKRKAGSKDIVKSVLEFDEVPTEGSPNLVESGTVAQAIGNLGQPLQWKGPATVAQLNAGITGIKPGWTYTLTDAGTLTDGSIAVEAGDEVAWTEDGEWFKVGGDSGKIAVFKVTYPMGQTVYPDPDEILAAIDAGKFVVIDQPNIALPGNHTEWLLEYSSRGAQDTIKFINGSNTLIAARDNTAEEPLWQWETGYTVGIVNFGDKTDADLVEGVLTILGGDSLTKLTLTTAQTLTVKANSDVPNFALEIDNTGNGNDVTVTVVDFADTALKASAAGGDTVGAGKYAQLTCVGSCWTLAEFTVPTP